MISWNYCLSHYPNWYHINGCVITSASEVNSWIQQERGADKLQTFHPDVHFFCLSKRSEPKKSPSDRFVRAETPEKKNFSLFGQNAFGFALPKKAEVHTFSGLARALREIVVNYKFE